MDERSDSKTPAHYRRSPDRYEAVEARSIWARGGDADIAQANCSADALRREGPSPCLITLRRLEHAIKMAWRVDRLGCPSLQPGGTQGFQRTPIDTCPVHVGHVGAPFVSAGHSVMEAIAAGAGVPEPHENVDEKTWLGETASSM